MFLFGKFCNQSICQSHSPGVYACAPCIVDYSKFSKKKKVKKQQSMTVIPIRITTEFLVASINVLNFVLCWAFHDVCSGRQV